jgi:hypothetical protein
MSLQNVPKRHLLAAIRFLALVLVCWLVVGSGKCFAGGGPENAVVIVNDESASSKLIANHYVRLRKIPARNVIHLKGIPDRETTNLETYKTKILLPILQQLEIRKIRKSVDYILYSADFPTDITILSHKNLLLDRVRARRRLAKDAKVPSAKLYNGHASINSLTYFAVAVLGNEPGYLTLDSNSYYRNPAREILLHPFVGRQQKDYLAAIKVFDKGPGTEFDEAIVSLHQLAISNPGQAAVCYWLAKFYAVRGDVKPSVKWLTQAVQNGWVYREETKKEKAFENVRFNPLFRGLEDRIPDNPFTFAPTRGFKHQRKWAINGMVNGDNGQGNNAFLSTVLAVTRNYGTTEQEALAQLQASIRADESDPSGTFYFSLGKGVRNATRKAQIEPVVKTLKAMGKKAVTIKENLPKNAGDIVGLLTGTHEFDFAASGSSVVPGAICDHLTSFGGRLAVPGQTKLSEFIRFGAAGASGTVTEPYALAAKFPHAMIHVHYARGCSLAESFYQSVAGPFQLLIVGDALCQPYAVRPKVSVDGILPMQEVSDKVELKFDVSDSKVPVSMIEIYVDGMLLLRDHELKPLNFDTRLLADGYHEMRAVVTANDLIESNGHHVIPFIVNNSGHSITMRCDKEEWSESENIFVEVTSNFGDTVNVVQNMRPVSGAQEMTEGKRPLRFKIPAQAVGRGPVELQAVVIDKSSGRVINSPPVYLQVDGAVDTTKRNTERPKPKPPKPVRPEANSASRWTPRV